MADSEMPAENPRTRRVRELMLSTAIELLLEGGAQEVTAARIADRADVARTTVYRQWPDQRSLLLATVQELTSAHLHNPPDGHIDDDVRKTLERIRTRLVKRDVRSVYSALAGQASLDETFRDAKRLFIHQLTQPVVLALESNVARGALPASIDCTFEANLLAGPILHCHLALHEDITDELIDAIMERWERAMKSA